MRWRYGLYILAGAAGLVILWWLISMSTERNLQVIQPPEGLPPGTRYLRVRWKAPLKKQPEGKGIPFRIEPAVPIVAVSWMGPAEAVLQLGNDLKPGQTYELRGEKPPFTGRAKFFVQPVRVVRAEGGYVWGTPEQGYYQAVYVQTNAPYHDENLQVRLRPVAHREVVRLREGEFVLVSEVPAQKPLRVEAEAAYAEKRLWEGRVEALPFRGYELRSAEAAYEGGRFVVRLRGNRPVHAQASEVVSYLRFWEPFRLAEVEVQGLEVRLYAERPPSGSLQIALKEGFPDGRGGLEQPDTLALQPPTPDFLAWAQGDIHYVAPGQGLRFLTGSQIQSLRVRLWRILPQNERYFMAEIEKSMGWYWGEEHFLSLCGPLILNHIQVVEGFPVVESQGGFAVRALGKELEPGTYFVELSPEENSWRSLRTWFVVSDWYLLARQGKDEVWVAAMGREGGRPLSGVRVALIDPAGETHSESTTNKEGVALLPIVPFRKAHILIARRGSQTLILDLNKHRPIDWAYETKGFDPNRQDYYLYFTTARTLYRPGDTIVIHGYLRSKDWRLPPAGKTLTLSWEGPRQTLIPSMEVQLNADGHFCFSYPLPLDAPTGRYTLRAVRDAEGSSSGDPGLEWQYEVEVEFFRPDRLVIQSEAASQGSAYVLRVSGAFLYGAPAASLKGEVSAGAVSAAPETPLARGYVWQLRLPEDWKENYLSKTAFQTDARGQAQIPLPSPQGAGYLEVKTLVILYDDEGRPTYLPKSTRLATQPYLVGVRDERRWVEGGTPLALSLRALSGPDYSRLAKGSLPVTAEVWEIRYEYQLYTGYYSQYRHDYQARRRRILRSVVELKDGEGVLTFTPHSGTYEVLLWAPQQQYPTLYHIEAWGWGETNALRGSVEGQVVIEPQDTLVEAGEKAALLIKAPFPGKALLTIERERVWEQQWIDLRNGTATTTIKVREVYAPGVYVHVVAFHATGGAAVPFPSSRGLVYLPVHRRGGIGQIAIEVLEQAQPGTVVRVRLRAPRHSRAHVLLTATDEGLWQRQPKKPQPPEATFYMKQAHTLAVREHLPYVAPWGKEVIGGGDEVLALAGAEQAPFLAFGPATREAPVFGEAYEASYAVDQEVRLNDRGEAQVEVTLPLFSGKVRWRAYLIGEGVYGSAEAFTTVAAPVVARMGLPFYLAEGDEVETQLSLRNTTQEVQKGQWQVSVEGEGVAVSPTQGTFSLKAGEAQTVPIRYKATRPWGLPTVSLYLSGSLAQARQIRLRPAEAPRVEMITLQVTPGQDTTLTLPSTLFYNPRGQATLVISTTPISEVGPSLLSLLRFPHGCAEQISSQAFASLKLGEWVAALSDAAADSVRRHIEYVLGRLSAYRAYGGEGYTFWPGGGPSEPWLTNHIVHFLMEAEKAGYGKASDLLRDDVPLLHSYVRSQDPKDFTTAYSAFLLARLKGSEAASDFPSVKAAEKSDDPVVRAFWRAAFALARQPVLPAPLPLLLNNLYSPAAEALYGYAESFVQGPERLSAFRGRILQRLREPYLSTREVAWLLLAYERLSGADRPLSGSLTAGQRTVSLSGRVWRQLLSPNGASLRLRGARDTLYVFVWGETYPRTPQPAIAQGLTLTEELIPQGGQKYLWRIRLRQADASPLENIALTVPYPAGFTPDRSNFSEESRYPEASGLKWDYADLREDRFLGYFSVREQEAQIELPLRLLYPGRYRIPSISVLVMYSPALQATTASRVWQSQPL